MRLWLGIASLLFLVSGTLSDDFGFNLEDAFDDPPKVTEKPKSNDPPKVTEKPKSNDDDLNLWDALGPDTDNDKPKPGGGDSGGADIPDILDFGPPKATKKPAAGDGTGFDLYDALGPDPDPKPNKPANPGQGRGGDGSFGLDDLQDVAGDDYKPDKGSGGRRPQDPGYDPHGGAGDQPQEAGSGQIAGIASAIGVALLGAASSYFAYQKKKLCFKLQGGVDPESGKGHHGTHSEPQVLSNLLRSS